MYRPLALSLLITSLITAGSRGEAQGGRALVGAWERTSIKDSTGTPTQPTPPVAFTIFSADGFYSQTAFPTGRSKIEKPLADYTKEELLTRFNRAEARRGHYTVAGNTLTRAYDATLNPNDEGRAAQVQRFRIEGDVLILTSPSPANKSETRWRRAK